MQPPRVYEIDIATGDKVNKWLLSGGTSMESLIWHPEGHTLWSTADRLNSKDLVTITLGPAGSETGTVAFVDPSGFPDLEGLAFVSTATANILLSEQHPTDTPTRTLPTVVALHQNVPNPFNPATTISFDLPQPGHARLEVFSVEGRLIASLLDHSVAAGLHTVTWRGHTTSGQIAPSGIYYYRLSTGGFSETRKMILLK